MHQRTSAAQLKWIRANIGKAVVGLTLFFVLSLSVTYMITGYLPSDSSRYSSFENIKYFAEKGDAYAEFKLGYAYYIGENVPQDFTLAYKWYLKAAEQGIPVAQHNLALLYARGQGVEKDYKSSHAWHLKAAEQRYIHSLFIIASMYEDGIGTSKNMREACQWYLKAEAAGSDRAESGLGRCYLNPDSGFDANYPEALKWFRKGAEKNDPYAQYQLAYMYSVGMGVPIDPFQVSYWAGLAAAQEVEGAKKVLIDAHQQCTNISDITLPFRSYSIFFSCAIDAQAGNPDAQYIVGTSYYAGKPSGKVLAGQTEAAKWFRKAAEQGHAPSQMILGKLYYKGEGVEKNWVESYAWNSVAMHVYTRGGSDVDVLSSKTGQIWAALKERGEQEKAELRAKEYIQKYSGAHPPTTSHQNP